MYYISNEGWEGGLTTLEGWGQNVYIILEPTRTS
jgi:hypothetical protein